MAHSKFRKALLAVLILLAFAAPLTCGHPAIGEEKAESAAEKPARPLYKFISFQMRSGRDFRSNTIRCYHANDGTDYVFLPACAGMDAVTVAVTPGPEIFLGETRLHDGMTCGAFPLNTPLALHADGYETSTLMFVPSANVAAMFIDTQSGSMREIHEDKTHKEYASIAVYDADGRRSYLSVGTDRIRGHGQWTWDQQKKSYNLYLNRADALLGMSPAKKWVLISNVLDESSLRNWMVYRVARQLGSYRGFAPDCAFVDLYLNGRYNGLYLLCEKVELHPNRLSLAAGSWLFDFDWNSRAESMKNSFGFGEGTAVEVKVPVGCTEETLQLLKDHLADFQAALLSESGVSPLTGRSWDRFIDLDSFARKYLIEEIFENLDGGACSQYYFWNAGDDLIYAGPCWDYDNILGISRQKTPNCFLARRERKSPGMYTPWFHALWQREAFRNRVIELYRTEFLPAVQALLERDIPAQAARLEASSRMNSLRWQSYYASHPQYDGSIGAMTRFLEDRLAFLSSAWIDGVDYKTITFDLDGQSDYQFYCLPAGSDCGDIPTPMDYGLEEGGCWYLEDGTPFDPGTVLSEDITLYAYNPAEEESPEPNAAEE